MRIEEVRLHNYRRYEEAAFRFHPRFTVLIGDNGMGKTTVLDALAALLGTYFQGSGIDTGTRPIRKSDARFVVRKEGGQVFFEPRREVFLEAEALVEGQSLSWRRDLGDRGARARDFIEAGRRHRDLVEAGEDIDLPLMLYYGSGRLWRQHRDVPPDKPGSRLVAYRFALDPLSDHKAFERWFKRLTYASLQERSENPALRAIERAVTMCIPDARSFRFDVGEDRIVLEFEDGECLPFDSLSDGFRNMAAMVADIAHRSVRLNPHFGVDAIARTSGVVLVDEIDLHLHPRWQRRVVDDLKAAFPRLQFIATTHSPFILQSLEPGEVIDLDADASPDAILGAPGNVAAPGPARDYSNRSIEDIVEDVMKVEVPQRSHRYQQMYDAAKEYYALLQRGREANDGELERIKRKLDELSAPFSDNVAYHAFLEMERIAAGLGDSSKQEENR